MKKFIDILLNILIVTFSIVLLFSIYTSFQIRVLGNDYGNFFGYTIFEVQTGSMVGSINPSDWVIVKQTKSVKLNDIVTYKLGSEYITHRVIETYSGTYITKGDANNAKDEPVDESQIIGKVLKVLPNFGIVRKTLLEPAVLIVFIITLFLINMYFSKRNKEDDDDMKSQISQKILNVLKIILKALATPTSARYPVKPKAIKVSEEKIEIVKPEKEIAVKISGSDNLYEEVKNKYSDSDNDLEEDTEDELAKTAFFRMVSVDDDELKDRKKETTDDTIINKEEDNTEKNEAIDLNKTAYFRAISVDADEINDTLMEIAENEIKTAEQNKAAEVEVLEIDDSEADNAQDNSTLTSIELKMLNAIRNAKSKNTIEKAMRIKAQEIDEIIQVFFNSKNQKLHIAKIKEGLIQTYITARYYNRYEGDILGYNGKNKTKIQTAIKKESQKMIDSYKGSYLNYKEIINDYKNALLIIIDSETIQSEIKTQKALIEYYESILNKYCEKMTVADIKEIISIRKRHTNVLDSFLEEFESAMFNLLLNTVTSKKNTYALELEHNIAFSKIYSSFIVDRIYNKGIVAEDKMKILLTFLSTVLIKDMIQTDFAKEYIFYLPSSLYMKNRKLKTILEFVDDAYAKNNTVILINFTDFVINAKTIEKIRKQGYRLAVVMNKKEKMVARTTGYMYMFDYIFVDKSIEDYKGILETIPHDLLDRVVNDKITDKVGDFGGED